MDTLQKYKNKPLFEVPEHYFEQLQYNVMQRVKKEVKSQNSKKQWISAISVAASFAIIITLSFFLFVNRNTNEHFYVHEEIINSEDSILASNSNLLAEVTEHAIVIPTELIAPQKPLSSNAPLVAETIVYRAVDFYLDDFTTDSFCEMMYDLECYYDY